MRIPRFQESLGLAAIILAFGATYSMIRGSDFKVETANHKVELTSAITKVKQEVSDTLTQSARQTSTQNKKQVENKLKLIDQSLSQVQSEILADEEDEDILEDN